MRIPFQKAGAPSIAYSFWTLTVLRFSSDFSIRVPKGPAALATVGATLLSLIACGGPAPTPTSIVDEKPVAQNGESIPAEECPFELTAADQPGVNYRVLGNESAVLRVQQIESPAEHSLWLRYESRDDAGLERGVLQYDCAAAGLLLRELSTDDVRLVFSPPLPAVPSKSVALETVGDVQIESSTGATRAAYSHVIARLDVVDSPAPTAALTQTRAVLIISWDTGTETTISAETDWDLTGVPRMERTTRTTVHGGVTTSVTEIADSTF